MLSVSRRILVSAPRDSVQAYLSDLAEIAKYDPKVDAVEAEADGGISASGRFLGLPWRAAFRVEFSADGGYRAVMSSGPLRSMECRMTLRPVVGGTVLERVESCELPLLLRPFSPFVRRWLDHTLETVLDVVKEGAEAHNRRLQLQRLEA